MTRRRLVLAACALVALGGIAVFVAYAVVEPEGNEDDAVGAAINAMVSDDPSAGTWGECEHEPSLDTLRLRARYDCVVRACDSVMVRVQVTDHLLDGWTFKRGRTRLTSVFPKEGEIEPLPSTTLTEIDPSSCGPADR